jgi:hypothetical protein
MAKRKVKLGDQELQGEAIPFESESRESWNTYLLEDGTALKLKAVLSEVIRVDGMYTPTGEPLYVVSVAPVIATVSPDVLKRKD